MIPTEGLTENSPNIILYPRLINTTKGRIVVYSEAEHKEKAPDQYEEARLAFEARKNRVADPYPKLIRLTDGSKKLVKSKFEEDAIIGLMKGGEPVFGGESKPAATSAPVKVESAASLMATEPPKTNEPEVNQVAPKQPAQDTKRKAGRPKKGK